MKFPPVVTKQLERHRRWWQVNKIYRWSLISLAAFVMINIVIGLAYGQRTYPNTTIADTRVGSVSFGSLSKRLPDLQLLPKTVSLTYQKTTVSLSPVDLGMQLDERVIMTSASNQRSWLPMLNFITLHHLPVGIKVDQTKYQKAQTSLAAAFHQDAHNAHLVLKDGSFSVQAEAAGYQLDTKTAQSTIVTNLAEGHTTITVPTVSLTPQVKQQALQADLTSLQKQQKTSITFRYQSKNKRLSASDIAGWYAVSGNSYALADAQIKASVLAIAKGLDVNPQNITEAVQAGKHAIQTGEAMDFSFVPVPSSRTFTYCIQLKNVDASYLSGLQAKLQSTYADSRGWSLSGQVSFVYATSGCNFTVWLAAADQMSSFGTICDSQWSCTVSPNVILNFDRWSGASSAWNAAGGNLDDYRSMVINHETGHWLGFGHHTCPGPGQAAPVMQQQSIDLQGCKFNPWPVADELATLRGWLGL